MPRVIAPAGGAPVTLAEAADALADGFDPRDEGSTLWAAGWLERLGANRDFLADEIARRLTARHRDDSFAQSGYGPQALVLSPLAGDCFLRANIWPGRGETALEAGGERAFVYGIPHDHNFDFLTVGYFGPGYISDYYEYDYEALAGHAGEAAGLRFVERSALGPGRLLHYRAHVDVHAQLVPDTTSVSLNIMHVAPEQGWFDQYGFDLGEGVVSGVLGANSTEVFLRCAVALGSPEALDLAERFAARHPSDRLRLACVDALAMRAPDPAARDAHWQRAEVSGSRLLAAEAARRRRALAQV